MLEPDPQTEKKVLRAVVLQMRDVEHTARTQARLKAGVLGAGTLVATVAFFLALNALAHPLVAAFVASLGGAALGFGLMLSFIQEQWPVTQRYIDMERVHARLQALEQEPGKP